MVFTDRTQAGNLLAEKLSSYRGKGVIVLGLARGGVVTARATAHALQLPLDVLVVKKIGAPGESELAIGALAPDNVTHIDWRLAERLGVDEEYIKEAISRQSSAIRQKTLLYRKGKKALPALPCRQAGGRQAYKLREKTVILADDGAATGSTIEAAIKWLRKKHAKRIVVALPIAPKELLSKIAQEVDELVILATPDDFGAVGQFYEHFEQVTDEEVIALLRNKSEARNPKQ